MTEKNEELIAEAKRLIADCSTYNFGMRNADRLAHEVAPKLVDALEAEFDHWKARNDAGVAARTATILSQLFPDTEGDVGVKPAAVRKWLGFRAAEYREEVQSDD